MKEETILSEYVIGGKRGSNNLTPNSTLHSIYLLTDMYTSLTFYYKESNNVNSTENYIEIKGIEFDNTIIFGAKFESTNSVTINLDKDNLIFDSMETQNILIPTFGDGSWSYWQYLSYIKIVYKNVEYLVGKPTNNKNNSNLSTANIYWSELYTVINPCVISGIGLSNDGLFCLQIIEAIKGNFDSEAISTFTYGRGDIGFIESQIDNKTFKDKGHQKTLKNIFDVCNRNFFNLQVNFGNNGELKNEFSKLCSDTRINLNLETFIMDFDLIGFEDPETFILVLQLYDRLRGWSGSSDVLYTYYPLFLSLLDKAMLDRNFKVMQCVNRIHRMLNRIIYYKENILKNTLLENQNINKKTTVLHGIENKPLVIKLNKIWKCFVKIMCKCQKIQQSQISLNVYQVALLSPNNINHKLYAFITILCQISLIILIGIDFLTSQIDTIFPIIEGKIIIPIIFMYTCMIAYKQYTNTIDFRDIFPDLKNKRMGILDYFSNVICAFIIIIFNFFLLSFNYSVIDIVLNSVASLFVIELDDSAVFLSSDSLQDLLKQQLIDELKDEFESIPKIYFNNNIYTTWKFDPYYCDYFRLNESKWIHDTPDTISKQVIIDEETMEIVLL